ncbi:G-type lectin S-receptor-like serine/threonine-protein kinase At1g11410 isoform X1 [Mangifera indica]|uniref:G-type lectin S-receptor-like serine/threonine-protein kinase At1g11410 isoform X1 n=1 Tax=Mangifera indica TaxID=29780 RepID=UPI001CFBB93B|nr:G-type lectin S-receptor-like serine/threonine-protein kinase At1g11410 isoform X1 [Mangifera indica]
MMATVRRLLKTFLVFHLLHLSTSIDTISSTQFIKDGDLIISRGKIFALGFFSPGNSVKRYVGIWYFQVSEPTIVWVANRDSPVNDSSGILSIDTDGNLALFESNQTVPLWTTNISVVPEKNAVAQLLDSGNLVLLQNDTGKLLWQSFDCPTHTLLPFMKLGLNRRTGLNRELIAWKSADDPGTGKFSYRIDPTGFPQLTLYKGTTKWWRSGSWTGQRWSGVPEMTSNYIFNVTFINNQDEISIVYGVTKPVTTRLMVNESGFVQRFTWSNSDHRWIGFWSAPKEQCDYYDHCGANSNCDPYHADKFECTCLPGFEPNSLDEWYLRDTSGGCKRKRDMSMCQKGEGFVKVAHVKIPDTNITRVEMSLDLKACERECLRNCSCLSYSSAYGESKGGIGCLMYHGDLIDTRSYTNAAGQDLYLRVDAAELALYTKKGSLSKKTILAIVLVISVATILLVAFVFWLFRRRRRAEKAGDGKNIEFNFTSSLTQFEDSMNVNEPDGNRRDFDLPMFQLSTIVEATNNFSVDRKLGEGGFGSVYKGILQNGKEIAIKRLSKYSGQGIEQFKNEVLLIARLQHRNLVSILGCCIEGEEKMLVYEYLPNKSLDAFIFDETKRAGLDWSKRFEIIFGIVRGILYLHQDSRLRIIHRDLKASNVLIDATLNPKISDFGMARIFGGDQIEANTNRVVGTYGYMSPEYAMEGQFSVKSDVYSFGVLLLEIITGRKNSGFYLEDAASSNLVGHIWDLWREGRSLEMVDELLGESYSTQEALRCIQIGLLCVQEQPADRPTMAMVASMLGNDKDLPDPKRPAFIAKRVTNTDESSGGISSVNEVTISIVRGR